MRLIKKLLIGFVVSSSIYSINVLSFEMTALYDVTVAYDTINFRSNRNAHKKALEKLLIRVIGPHEESITTLIDQYFPEPSRFIRQFRPGHKGDLIVSMDGEAVQEILLDANQSIWGVERPLTIIFVAIDKGMGEREVLASDGAKKNLMQSQDINKNQLLKQKMLAMADYRGIPIVFPSMDNEDQSNISFSDIWGDFTGSMLDVSEKYNASIILSAKVRNDEREINDWTLHIDNNSTSFSAAPDEAINILADTLITRYSYSDRIPAKEIEIIFEGVDSINDFGDIYLALNKLSMIESFTVKDVSENYVQYLISYNGFTSDLVTSINDLDLWMEAAKMPDKLQYIENSNLVLQYKLKYTKNYN